MAVILDLLRAIRRDCHDVTRADRARRVVANGHAADASLNHIPLGDLERVQLRAYARFNAGPGDRDFRVSGVVQELRYVAALARPDFFRVRFVAHKPHNTRPALNKENNMPHAPEIRDLLNLDAESVLVTGASSNIGQAIATRLAAAGASILAHYNKNRPAVDQLLQRIGAGTALQADLADEAAVDAMLESVRPTMLVHNAAMQTVENLASMSLETWRSMMAANLDSAFMLTQRLAKAWTAAGRGGAIVNISSIEGMDPALGHAHYASSKAGLSMLTRAAAQEFGAAGIRVNSVSPGLIDRDGLAQEWPDGVSRWHERAPLSRMGTPNDVADAVLFLLSPASRWISGSNLVVDGGMSSQGKW